MSALTDELAALRLMVMSDTQEDFDEAVAPLIERIHALESALLATQRAIRKAHEALTEAP